MKLSMELDGGGNKDTVFDNFLGILRTTFTFKLKFTYNGIEEINFHWKRSKNGWDFYDESCQKMTVLLFYLRLDSSQEFKVSFYEIK